MGKVYFGMIQSLDGFVADSNGELKKLFASYVPHEGIPAAMENTGAVVMGRNTFEMAEDTDAYADNYEFQVPLFILTHNSPARHPKENEQLTITFVEDGIEQAISLAKAAANGKDVLVLGASTGQQLLAAGLADELQIAIAPILLGRGIRLFEGLENQEIHLEKLHTFETEQQVEIWYKVMEQKEAFPN